MTRALWWILPAMPVVLALGGCGPVVQIGAGKGARPPVLYTISAQPAADTAAPAATPSATAPAAAPAAAAIDAARAVSVATPTTPGALQTVRIPVIVSDTEIQYVPAANWSEQPNILFQRLVASVLGDRGVNVIDLRSTGRTADRRLTGQLQDFGVDLRHGRQVRVNYTATLSAGATVYQRQFEKVAPVDAIDGTPVVRALNRAANEVAAEVADWVRALP